MLCRTAFYHPYVPSSPPSSLFPPELIHGKKPGAVNALQLCSLLLPQTNRLRLHRVLRLINKAGGNTQLQLSKTQTNRQVVSQHDHHVWPCRALACVLLPFLQLLDAFATLALRPSSKGSCSEQERTDSQTLVSFLSLHYQQVFTVFTPSQTKQLTVVIPPFSLSLSLSLSRRCQMI